MVSVSYTYETSFESFSAVASLSRAVFHTATHRDAKKFSVASPLTSSSCPVALAFTTSTDFCSSGLYSTIPS